MPHTAFGLSPLERLPSSASADGAQEGRRLAHIGHPGDPDPARGRRSAGTISCEHAGVCCVCRPCGLSTCKCTCVPACVCVCTCVQVCVGVCMQMYVCASVCPCVCHMCAQVCTCVLGVAPLPTQLLTWMHSPTSSWGQLLPSLPMAGVTVGVGCSGSPGVPSPRRAGQPHGREVAGFPGDAI